MLRALIAGGAGFIGSHLCDRFLKEGYEVVALDNLISGDIQNISHLMNNPRFTFIQHDICRPLDELEKLSNLSVILHFASPASPNPKSPISYINHPIETLLANTVGTYNLLELASSSGAEIILASTAEIYGNPTVHPQPEDYRGNVSPIGVRSSYDEGKRCMEAYAFAYYRSRGTKIKVIRLFNTYGGRMRLDDGRIVPNLLNSLVNSTPFPIHGNGSTTRSFAYISDIVDGIFLVASSENALGQVINLGNPKEYTLDQTLSLFEQVCGKKLDTVSLPTPPEDPIRRQPDIAKAQSLLGWNPKIDFAAGLKLTLPYYG